MRNDTEVSVLEMGMSNAGEIEYLSKIAEPDIAIITNIGSSHMEYLGSREGICKAKLEIVKGLKKGGTLLLNGDDDILSAYTNPDYNVIYVGIENECDFRAINIRETLNKTVFDIKMGDKVVENVVIPTVGKHNVYAALFAFATGMRMNVPTGMILRGLASYRPVGMRQNIYELGKITVIEDCYNASPESMKAAIGVLGSVKRNKGKGRMLALLGNMYELGASTEAFHEQVGKYFAEAGGEALFTFGEIADHIAGGALLGGLDNEHVFRNANVSDPALSGEMLLHSLREGDTLLVKASRGAAAERVIAYLRENQARLCM
jgi:UDP-N-acetylmuramoyl-tripeptide--D-alanyl-D-alanine ligase